MALPPKPNRLSDDALGSLLNRQARALAEQLRTDQADLTRAGHLDLAEAMSEAESRLRALAEASEPNLKTERPDV